jgi:hypothetical protein
MRLRILGGALALVAGLAIYALAVMALAIRVLPANWAIEAVFYLIAGIAWIPLAARLTSWMQQAPPYRPPPAP